MTEPGCVGCRELAAEFALGLVTGRERADALAHLQGCAACGEHVAALTRLHDGLRALIPAVEPPLGFESRIMARLRAPGIRRRRWVVAAAAVGATVALVVGGRAVTQSLTPTTDAAAPSVAPRERTVLFAPLVAGGREVGQAYAYVGRPSWLYLYLDDVSVEGPLTCAVLRRDGTTVLAASVPLLDGDAFWGGPVTTDRATLGGVRVTDATGAVLATAGFDGTGPR